MPTYQSRLQRPTYTPTRPTMQGPIAPRPADRQDGQYLQPGQVPLPGERPTMPRWEGEASNEDIESGLTGGGGFTFNGGAGSVATARTREVQDNERVSSQLSRLLSGDSAYIGNARRAGANTAAARGLASSGMAAGNAQAAAIDAGLPIAAQDAAWYGRTAADNMDAENAASIVNANNTTQLAGQAMGIEGGLREAMLRGRQSAAEAARQRNFGREENIWNSEEAGRERDFTRERQDFDAWNQEQTDLRRADLDEEATGRNFSRAMLQQLFSTRANVMSDMFSTIMQSFVDNPEEWDEFSASGMMQYFGQEGAALFNGVFDNIFGPSQPAQPDPTTQPTTTQPIGGG